jgi:hypothetical protein
MLEPYRPATLQRPLLAASARDAHFSIDGTPAEAWVPTPGTHNVVATRGDETDQITISYE